MIRIGEQIYREHVSDLLDLLFPGLYFFDLTTGQHRKRPTPPSKNFSDTQVSLNFF
jgi:hypothetical protein